MRILYFTSESFPTFRADVAGLFGKFLPAHGVHSDLVTDRAEANTAETTWAGGAALVCHRGKGPLRHLRKWLHCIGQLLVARRTDYAGVQVRDMPILAAFLLILARLKRLPFCYWMSYPIPEGQMARALASREALGFVKFQLLAWRSKFGDWLLYRIVLAGASHVFVQSEQMKIDVAARGIASERLTPVPMGVDWDSLCGDIAPSDDARLDDKEILVYLGTQEPPRQIERLFEALARVRTIRPNVVLALVGDTVDARHRSWLRERAAEAGVADALIWTGWLPMAAAWRYVYAARVGLSPFPRGTLLDSASPTKVPEYLAVGVPVVCNDNPDQMRVISESGAGICVSYTPEEFASAILALLSEDEQIRSARISNGKAYIKRHRDYRVLSASLAEVYRRVLGGAAGA